jgi:alkylation response protein AidB-like acyl-CoA dehydrogenase
MDAFRRAVLPSEEAQALFELTEELGTKELAPRAAGAEAAGEFPREVFRKLGQSGLLGLPYDEAYGGGGQPYAVYLQVVEELARHWLAVGLGVSVHTLSCHALAGHGSEEQKGRWLPEMIGGDLLGAYCLSEPAYGSDAANLATRARQTEDGGYVLDGTKAWITHGGEADFYTVLARTGGEGPKGISAFLVEAGSEGLSAASPEHKMGMRSSTTAQMRFEGVRVPPERLVGEPGEGFEIAMNALDCGRLGIAACAVGVAQAALDAATAYAKEREQFGRPIIEHDAYLAAARLRDQGLPFSRQAAIAKLHCTDAAMQTTVDAVQVFGGAGYTTDFPVERFMREAKVLQIVEGTNQIQRRVIARSLAKG